MRARPARADPTTVADARYTRARTGGSSTRVSYAGSRPACTGLCDVVGSALAGLAASWRASACAAFSRSEASPWRARSCGGFCVLQRPRRRDRDACVRVRHQARGLRGHRRAPTETASFYPFEDDPDLIIADIHEDGRYLYPGTGARTKQQGSRAGPKLNTPLAPRSGDAIRAVWPRVAAQPDQVRTGIRGIQCGRTDERRSVGAPRIFAGHARARKRESGADRQTLLQGTSDAFGGGGYDRNNLAKPGVRSCERLPEGAQEIQVNIHRQGRQENREETNFDMRTPCLPDQAFRSYPLVSGSPLTFLRVLGVKDLLITSGRPFVCAPWR